VRPVLFFFLLSLPAAFPQAAHQHHPPRSAEEYARVLNDPKRDAWQLPDAVIKALDLKRDEVIADIGAGSGYFAKRFTQHAAKVYAVDIDEKLLAMVRDGAPPNLETLLASPDDPRLPDASVDTIFFCNVLHHVENRQPYYAKLARALKPGGRVVIVEFHKKPLPVGPPESMKLSPEQVINEFAEAGFRHDSSQDFLPYQYLLVFKR
jgi:ubiquinone/menaquinone biosynthesis C-methylase UbiE